MGLFFFGHRGSSTAFLGMHIGTAVHISIWVVTEMLVWGGHLQPVVA